MPDEATPDADGSQIRAPGAAAPLVFCGAIRCDARAVSRLLCGLRAALVTRDVPHAEDDSWELVLAEILNNVVEHACHGDDRYLIVYWLRFAVEGLVGTMCRIAGRPYPAFRFPRAGCGSPRDRRPACPKEASAGS